MKYVQRLFVKSAITTAVAVCALLPQSAAACNSESYIGTVCSFAMSWCPRGWLPANGQVVPINTNQALFSLLSFQYGGDGKSTFALPDLQGRAVVGTGSGVGLAAVKLGEKIGEPTASVVVPLPAHIHTATFAPISGSQTINVPQITGTGLTVSGQTITNTLNLTAVTSGLLKIAGGSTVTGTVSTPTNGAILAKPAVGTANIYNTSAAADTTLGPSQTLSGPVSGTVVSSISNGTVTGTPTIPAYQTTVQAVTGGTVTVASAGSDPKLSVPTQSPSQGLTVCIMAQGLYPDRP